MGLCQTFTQSPHKNHKLINIDKISGYDLLTCDLHYNADVVIHLAGLSGVRDSMQYPEEYWKQNVIASQRLFDFFKDTKILYASSSTAYGFLAKPLCYE